MSVIQLPVMKKFKSLPVVICLFISVLINAQTGYKPGYIITLTNDTVRGKILFTASQRNNKVCCFKTYDNKRKKEYKPFEISGYRFDEGKYFISKRVSVYSDTLSLFVECIVQGRASFYYLRHENTDHYYIATGNNFIELTEPEQIITLAKTQVYKQPGYYGKLLYLLQDCPEIKPEIKSINLNHKDLISLGQDYHRITCDSGECVVFERKVKSSSFSIGMVAGYTFSNVSFGNSLDDKNAQGVFAGITTNINNILSSDERLTIGIDLLLQYNKTLNLSEGNSGVLAYVEYDGKTYCISEKEIDGILYTWTKSLKVRENLFALKTPVVLNYSFGSGKMHYSFGLGPVLSFTLSQNKSLKYYYFTEVYGKTVPGFLYGGIARCALEYNIREKNSVFAGVSYDRIINTGDVDQFFHLVISTLSFRAGIRF